MRLLHPIFENLPAYHASAWDPGDGLHIVVSVSGGRSSAYQAWHLIEANPDWRSRGWLFVFENTGRELEETLLFVHRLDTLLGLGIHWLEYDPTAHGKVKRVTFETAARDGEPFDALLNEIIVKRKDGTAGVRPLPNPKSKICTGLLKIKTLHYYVRRHLGWPTRYYSFVGYRADPREHKRYLKKKKSDANGWHPGGRGLFPMHDAGVLEENVQRFWLHAPFDLEIQSEFGNCDFCFEVSTWKLKARMLLEALTEGIVPRPGAEPPRRLGWWIRYEEARPGDRPGRFNTRKPTYRQLWEQVCAGDMASAVPENVEDVCRSCSD